MGFLSSLLPVAGAVVGNIVAPGIGGAIGGALGSALGGSGTKQSGTQTTTQQQQIDPRFASILYGSNGDNGFLSQVAAQANQPQSSGQIAFGNGINDYLRNYGTDSFNRAQQAAQGLQDIQRQAPQIGWSGDAGNVNAGQVGAPSQNGLDLRNAYQNFIYGDAGANPYLKNALQSGINQSNQAFQTNVGDITNALQRQVLPGLRSNSIAAGQFGSSRQGIAEGLALSDYTKQLSNAANQQGLANIAATTGAQSNAFNQGQDRALNALNTLSGQQYGTALSNAQLAQQAALANQQNAQQNANRNLNRDTSNAQLINQTNAQNDARNIAGVGLSGNLLNQANAYANQNNSAALNRLGQVGGILSPFTNVNQTNTSSQPLYSNPTANALGTAGTALGLYNQFKGIGGGGSSDGLFDLFGSGSGGSLGSSLIF